MEITIGDIEEEINFYKKETNLYKKEIDNRLDKIMSLLGAYITQEIDNALEAEKDCRADTEED